MNKSDKWWAAASWSWLEHTDGIEFANYPTLRAPAGSIIDDERFLLLAYHSYQCSNRSSCDLSPHHIPLVFDF